MTAILTCVVVFGLIVLLSIRAESEQNSTEVMRLICDERSELIDDYLKNVEHKQEIVAGFAVSEVNVATLSETGVVGADGWSDQPICTPGSDDQRVLDEYLHNYVKRVEDVLQSAVSSSADIAAYYFRINPQLSTREKGFFYARISDISYSSLEMQELNFATAEDLERIPWYCVPLLNARAVWLDPYDSERFDTKVVSYVSPIYKGRTFVGVLGVDIRYQTLVDKIRDISIYKTGYAFLLEPDGTVLYHPTLEPGSNLVPDNPELQGAVEQMGVSPKNVEPIRYHIDGERRQMFYSRLSSGQILAVTAPVQEIYTSWMKLGLRMLLLALVLLTVFAEISAITVRRITKPLQRLTEASRAIAEGDYSVQLDIAGDDEVGTLTRAFQQLVEHMRVYISDLNSMAYRDALTGVKNKAAYDISAHKLSDMIRMGGREDPPEFALIMLDCNDLKRINDTYGHEKGDVYLRTACKLVCDVFPHSPVFRVGGDEFAVILNERPYEEREALMREFTRLSEQANERAKEPWEHVSIAIGIAAYDPSVDTSVEMVLQRADALMYENKRSIKQMRAMRTEEEPPMIDEVYE